MLIVRGGDASVDLGGGEGVATAGDVSVSKLVRASSSSDLNNIPAARSGEGLAGVLANCALRCGAELKRDACWLCLEDAGVLVRGTGISTLKAGGAFAASKEELAGDPVPIFIDEPASSPTLLLFPGVAVTGGPAEGAIVESKELRLLYKLPICACTRFLRAIACDEYPAPRYNGLA